MQYNVLMMLMSVKIPKCISTGMNGCVDVESPTRFKYQGTLMYSHDFELLNIPLRHVDLKVLLHSLTWILDNVLESMGQDFLEGGPYGIPH
jgi:hypothetical protein